MKLFSNLINLPLMNGSLQLIDSFRVLDLPLLVIDSRCLASHNFVSLFDDVKVFWGS